jgi:ankyrin repeat protein
MMLRRTFAFASLTTLALANGSAQAQLSLNPFGKYFENVARAAASNDANKVQQLVADGANPNDVDEADRTGLHIAALNGNLRIFAILVKAGARINDRDRVGNTPLHYAADRNQVEMVKLLIGLKATIDAENRQGMTPLMIGASRGNVEIVQVLLSGGANAAKVDFTGRDAAGWALEAHKPSLVATLKRAANGQH